jgi:hypothetical protein
MKRDHPNLYSTQYEVLEWNYTSQTIYADPFNQVELDVIAIHENGTTWKLPAYWAGGNEWRVRFAPPLPGLFHLETACSDEDNLGLHGLTASLHAHAYTGKHPLFAHGALRVAENRRTFSYADGTPFFWLGDTWWMGLSKRLRWPEDFQQLTADRTAKGFSVIQIVAGLYPDVPDAFDPRCENEAGFAWESQCARIHPAYFDMADLRIRWLVLQGLMPCILGSWGYYLMQFGLNKLKQHWRYLIARWAAYPVLWCIAGEGAMPYYLSETKEADAQQQRVGLTELGKFIRQYDPYQRLITIHPTQIGRDQVVEDAVLDFDMLQTGHGGYRDVSNTVTKVRLEYQRKPTMPVVVGETNYEGIIHATQDEVQRLSFWAAMLSGAAGYTYGANGIWQVNRADQPFGPSPHGGTWGNTNWEEASQLPGAEQLGKARRLLERYPWQQFAPHPEWIEPSATPEDVDAPFSAGIPGKVRIFYFYMPVFPWSARPIRVLSLEKEIRYRAFYWDPRTACEYDLGSVEPDSDGSWRVPVQPEMKDWVLILENI